MANEEGLSTLTQADIMKKGELSYVQVDNKDDIPDVHVPKNMKQTRRRSWIRTSSTEKNLLFLDDEHDEEKEAFMRLKLREISKIVEPEKKFLCLECGPKRKPMFILLDFRSEPSGCLEEWEHALRRMMGNAPPLRRKTETHTSMKRPQQKKPLRAQSTFQPTTQPPQVESPQTPEDVFEPPTFSGTASGGDSPGAVSTCSDTNSDLSPFSSLKSTCFSEPQPEELKCSKEWLKQHKFKDHEGKIFVTKTIPRSGLHIGDVICGINVNNESDITMNTARLVECIRETPDQTQIELDVQRGVEISVKEEEMGLAINIRGPKARRPNTVDVIMKGCNYHDDESGFAIVGINDEPVAVGTQTFEVTEKVREVFQQNCYENRLHLIPQSLRKVLAEADRKPPNDAHPDNANANDNVQEVRPLDVGDTPYASGNANPNNDEETEC